MQDVYKVFYKLCTHFFDENGSRRDFEMSNAVPDPFVDYLDKNVLGEFKYTLAPPNVSPDIVFCSESSDIFATEVKTSKVKGGSINFNSSLPCGSIIIDVNDEEKIIPCYYLFAQLMENGSKYEMGSLMMVDGDFINSDFDLYLESIGIRKKKIDIGSYGDGINKQRNMFMFPNPMGIAGLRSERSTLITKEPVQQQDELGKVAMIQKEVGGQVFYAYQAVRKLIGPFYDASTRTEETKPRQKFKITV